MKKAALTLALVFTLAACTTGPSYRKINPVDPPYKPWATADEAHIWAINASVRQLCEGLKEWKNENVRTEALKEMGKREISTKTCYQFPGHQLTPTYH